MRTDSRPEPNQNVPCRKYPSTAPPSGRPSAVTVATTKRRMPWSRAAS